MYLLYIHCADKIDPRIKYANMTFAFYQRDSPDFYKYTGTDRGLVKRTYKTVKN